MRFFLPLLSAALLAAPAYSSDFKNYTVSRSIEINADAQEVWNVIGDFCDIDDWHPAFVACALKTREGGGVHRILTMENGAEFVEKLIATEPGLSYTYSFVESPLPIDRYTGTLAIAAGDPVTVTWSSRFKSPDPEMEALVSSVYDAGLEALEAHFAN